MPADRIVPPSPWVQNCERCDELRTKALAQARRDALEEAAKICKEHAAAALARVDFGGQIVADSKSRDFITQATTADSLAIIIAALLDAKPGKDGEG